MGQVGAGRCSPGVDQSSRGCQPPSVCLDVETGATVRECERSCDWKIDSREMTFIFFSNCGFPDPSQTLQKDEVLPWPR